MAARSTMIPSPPVDGPTSGGFGWIESLAGDDLMPDNRRARMCRDGSPASGSHQPRNLPLKPRQILLPGFAFFSELQQRLVFGLVTDDEGDRRRNTPDMKGACLPKVQIRNARNARATLRDVDQFGRRSRSPGMVDSQRHVYPKSREHASIGIFRRCSQ